MSSKTKWIAVVVLVLVVAGALWWVYGKGNMTALPGSEQTGAVANSTSKPALESDVAAFDAQMQALSTAVAGLGASSDAKAVGGVAANILALSTSINKLATDFQALVSTAGNSKQNVTALQAALKDMSTQVGNAGSIAKSVATNAANTKKPMNAAGVASSIEQLKTAVGYLATAQKDIHAVSTGLAK